jgi:hypothetical protein
MIRVYPNLLRLLTCLIISIALYSCSPDVGAWKNDQIKSGRRDELHELNDKVFSLIKAGDTKAIQNYVASALLNDASTDAIIRNVGHQMYVDSFSRFDEYYVVNKYMNLDTISKQGNGAGAYKLIYGPLAEEMYIVFYTPAGKQVQNKQMITAVYAKYSYGWKLGSLSMQPYTLNGKTAPELYQIAKKLYDKKEYVDAYNNARMANSCLRPSKLWLYDNGDEIFKFYKKVQEKADILWAYPIVLADLPGKPKVIGLFNKTTKEGNFPVISYLTKVNLKNVEALKAENLKIRKLVSIMMPGIDKNNKYIYYNAYNQMPVFTEAVDYYEMVDKLK